MYHGQRDVCSRQSGDATNECRGAEKLNYPSTICNRHGNNVTNVQMKGQSENLKNIIIHRWFAIAMETELKSFTDH